MRRIGIMGGTFNPIHVGHLMLAEWARDELGLNQVWFIPTGDSYMKNSCEILPGRERLHMTRLAIQDNPNFRCLDIEVEREGYTYSYETLEQLKNSYPDDMFYFIVGADCLFAIESWRNPERILQNCVLGAALRGDADAGKMLEQKRHLEEVYCLPEGKICLLPFFNMPVSSTLVRQRIRKGQSVRYLVPSEVLLYIEEKGFYREKSI